MSNRTIEINDALYQYLLDVSLHEPEVFRRLREETARLENRNMQISPEQGQFMSLLIELIGARNAIEIGVFTGYSALCVARALPEDGPLIACDVNAEWTAIGRRYWQEAGLARKIELRLGPGVETLDALLAGGGAGRFDFVFIDADKPSYDAYYERALQLLRNGGLIAVDNVLWHGKTADPLNQDADTVAIRALNRKVHADSRVSSCIVPVGDGLLLARKREKSGSGE